MSGLSKHVQEDYREQGRETIKKEFIALAWFIDGTVENNPRAQFDWNWGNHDNRLVRFANKHPAWADVLDDPLGMLKSLGGCQNTHRIRLVQFEDPEETHSIGKMSWVHGHYTGKHVACQHVEAYGESITFGHAHTMQMFTAVRKGEPVAGYCIGHMMDKSGRRYLNGLPHRWVTGFAFLEHDERSGNYTQHLLPIVDGGFCFGGKYYHEGGSRKIGS